MGSSKSTMSSSTSKSSTTTVVSATEINHNIDKIIESNQVVIFSKSYCPYCAQTKGLFGSMGDNVKAKVIELDRVSNGGAIQRILMQKTGQRTVPNVFVNGKHLGGNDDAQAAYRTGRLQSMLL
eukprot:CAMPEP_0118708596 /NCGR_PEP_ID=MMETSP0800-20121206/22005_1 /TAXON_ID=210618 ORGANISM="Striatella unipunctata, Strain CCMP2910" /NCGR_SAMPLE_ID=MMETSP0800 /ASSEMBLY_ACC=CAM_ASM_000638 /LENGTH=123 /DNA_ID=CAMNT_0006611867 /DNA_START=9 /DNA_END=380 /DNA_ORIENTATION=+